ncbi:MAG: hypothetical protein KGL69_09755, partial [Alphaproteobacteria bacterium]|nr:hypothetical protein [Alphaproteobacteria bacterium]
NDTFLDWYEPAFWANHPDTYASGDAIYPPLAFEFVRLLSSSGCYAATPEAARACDASGFVTITLFMPINFILAVLAFRKAGIGAPWPRALALSLSASMLYGWERGNLVLPCFAAFTLGIGALAPRLGPRVLAQAICLNLKPYLLVVPFTAFLRRRWVEAFAVGGAALAIYLASSWAFGSGGPGELGRNMLRFMTAPADARYGIFQFSTTYDSLLQVLASSAPLRAYLGPDTVALVRVLVPIVIGVSSGLASLCLLGAVARPQALSAERAAAIGLSIMFVFASPGAYALIFLLFLIFQEPWDNRGLTLALVAAYLWCIPWDYNLAPVIHETNFSFLAGRPVGFELSLTLGELLRPALVLLMQIGLVWATAPGLVRAVRSPLRRTPSAVIAPEAVNR